MNIYKLFEDSRLTYPDKVALNVDSKSYTYKDLGEKIDEISAFLGSSGSAKFIGLLAHRSLLAFSSVLAILKTANAYVPLNPKFPNERNSLIAEIAEIDTIIVEDKYKDLITEIVEPIGKSLNLVFPDTEKVNLDDQILKKHRVISKEDINVCDMEKAIESKTNYAYMLFTSGSTAKPKGVPISHGNVYCYVQNINSLNDFSSEDRFSNTFDLTFDLSVHDMFVCWSNGASLYCLPEKVLFAPSKYIKTNELTSWFSVPSLANAMNRLRMLKPDAYPSLKTSLFCGEPLNEKLAASWQIAAPNSIVKNIYGPTEATIGITEYRYKVGAAKSNNGVLSIGKIFNNNTFKIVSEELAEIGGGESGELLLSGKQLTTHYWKNSAKTTEQFVEIDGKLWYKTGDIVSVDTEGDLFYAGRKDFQVKIQGYRVELNEIDHVISEFLNTENVVTLAYTKGDNVNALCVFINVQTENRKDVLAILNHCKSKLPSYMVPERIVFVEEFPLNSNGKIDRKELIAKFADEIKE